jgi:hypothetical protein
MNGEIDSTDIRCLNEGKNEVLLKKSSVDSLIMAVKK